MQAQIHTLNGKFEMCVGVVNGADVGVTSSYKSLFLPYLKLDLQKG